MTMKNLFNYFAVSAFIAILIGMVYASIDSTSRHDKVLEQDRIERILIERRIKVDSLRITEVKPVVDYVQQ